MIRRMQLEGLMMITALRPLALVLMLGCTSCDGWSSSSDDDADLLYSLRYAFVLSEEFGASNLSEEFGGSNLPKRVDIAANLEATVDGKTHPNLSTAVSSLRTSNVLDLDIQFAPEAQYGATVQALKNANLQSFELSGLELHRVFEKRDEPEGASSSDLAFRGSPKEFELPVVVGYSNADNACYVSLFDETYDSQEFFDSAFEVLDMRVTRAGGIEETLVLTDEGAGIVARIPSTADTPWRCIAGAMYNVEIAGFPHASLEVMKPLANPES